ncbi:MAG TPA: glycosyltransferase family 4 protein [Actinomycetota bacterium]|nr:glycosyltransferase family 4 protein [Actinomycetota bacterium]
MDDTLRIAMLTYRGQPHSGGQGVYVRNLSGALTRLGHHVEVLSGPVYPDLVPGVGLVRLPSLDLYNTDRPFRPQRPLRSVIDAAEYAVMCAGVYPEPLTFSLRAWRWLARSRWRFDVVHDNQCLGWGLLPIARRLPAVATIHHAITVDMYIQLSQIPDPKARAGMARWFRFVEMQKRVARRLPRVVTVSEASRDDIVRDFGIPSDRFTLVPNGVDQETFAPRPDVSKVPGRIMAVVSADLPLKGLRFLIEAVAKLRTEREAELVVVSRPHPDTVAAVSRLDLEPWVRFESSVTTDRLVELYNEAEVVVVASVYEGFSLPAVEAMACGVPLVTTTGGALPEVTGPDGEAALHVPPGSPDAIAAAIARLLDDPDLRARLARGGRARVLDRYTWEEAASQTVDVYREVMASR